MSMSEVGSFTVLLQPSGWAFDAPTDKTLLRAAADAGIVLPSSCRNGTCRTCVCRLLSGTVGYVVEWPGLSREEKADGFVLTCVARAETPLVLDLPGARALPARS